MKKLVKAFIFIIISSFLSISCKSKNFMDFQLREGDIIFHESKSSQSKAIQLATNSRYSHMGILFKFKNSFYALEAVQPVKTTKLKDFVKKGVNEHYIIKRL